MEAEFTPATVQSFDGIASCIIGERLATLRELKEYYSFEEVMNMWETIVVTRINQYKAMKEATRE